MTILGSEVSMGCRLADMNKLSNQQATFIWTRKGNNDWRVENNGTLVVSIETFCIDEYYCTPQNRAGSGQSGTISLSGTILLIYYNV